MKSSNYMILGIVAILAVVGILWGTGSLSVIGEGVSETCRMNASTDSCTIELTLPEYRSVQTYNLDLQFSSVPGAYGHEVQITPITGVGPKIEEDNMDESSSLQDLETNYLYLYRLPSAWDVSDIYAVRADVSTTGWVKLTNVNDGSVDISMYFGVIDYPYTSNNVITCGESYDANTCIVRNYDRDYSRTPNEWKYYEYNLVPYSTRDYVRGVDLDTDDSDYPGINQQWNGQVVANGNFVLQDVMDKYALTDAKTELMMYVHLDADEREKGYVSWGLSVPPTVYLSYADEKRPTNTILQIGTIDVQTFAGQPENATTQDLASAINTYCETRAVGDKCTVPLTFKSMEDGIVKVTAETGQLRATSQETGRSGGNLLTGFAVKEFAANSVDFEGHPVQAYVSMGILFLITMIGIFTIGGKKK